MNALQQVLARCVSSIVDLHLQSSNLVECSRDQRVLLFLLQGQPILICSQGDEETKQLANRCIEIPQTVDCLQGLLSVIPCQLLSFHIAVLRGYDVSAAVSQQQMASPRVASISFSCCCLRSCVRNSKTLHSCVFQ